MLTPARRHISPLLERRETLKDSHHRFIPGCFHKLCATPSPRWAWSPARHNVVSFLTEAPEAFSPRNAHTQRFVSAPPRHTSNTQSGPWWAACVVFLSSVSEAYNKHGDGIYPNTALSL
ncbi:hypothetical protein CgunFtcFv8_005807 [Champsocephalus gunnari]|uniref:Uncharacterized protein n=1 Tax=Champsocephalus gunnari TaxID=52237 RepID=A0AAN8CW92_CHAGU|nr:hypothetical protein CgunFtcFv8_005807 [Champsocephalus gunnari]